MFHIICRCNKFKSLSLLSPTLLRHGVFNCLIPDAALSVFDPMREVTPKINNFLIFGKESISTKFKASIMPSDGSSKVKTGLPSTLFLIFHAAGISSFPLFNFLS